MTDGTGVDSSDRCLVYDHDVSIVAGVTDVTVTDETVMTDVR